MRVSQRAIHLLLVWFLLAALQNRYSITIHVQATESVDSKFVPAQLSSRTTSAYILSTWDEEKNQKASSGPNPIGNHRPPSRS